MTDNLTKSYPFDSMSVGDCFQVYGRFQHARVAASEYARRNGCVFTCRMQPDRTMMVYRVASDQAKVDNRGRHGRRRILVNSDPTALQFDEWLVGFTPGASYAMPASYSHLFTAMQAWCELHSIKQRRSITANIIGGSLIIQRTL